jgi:uncharacterized membrane protein
LRHAIGVKGAAEAELPESADAVAGAVLEMWPTALTFAISFLVIGQFWIAHHRSFRHLRRVDSGLLWCNLVFLLTVSFMPFPTAVLGSVPANEDRFPVVFYALSMTVASLSLTVTWRYAVHRRLLDDAVSAGDIRRVSRRAYTTSLIFAVSVAAAFLGLTVAVVFWLVVLPVARVLVSRR